MKDTLERRAAILRGIRSFFDGRGFVEVETAVRIAAPAPEEHIDCPTVVRRLSSAADTVAKEDVSFLRASPELQMKKLLALGMERIYQIGPCFREGERGSRHSPEFTMIEWYRRGADYRAILEDLVALVRALMASVGRDAAFPVCELTVREAYRDFAGWDPWTAWDQDRFDYDMATKVEPAIKARGGAVALLDYPPQAASLARLRGAVAERWEFYWNGMELANCFSELCDSTEQRRRFEAARAARKGLGEADYPIDDEFLGLLDTIGSAAGVALGVDRLVMVLLDATEISSVRAPV